MLNVCDFYWLCDFIVYNVILQLIFLILYVEYRLYLVIFFSMYYTFPLYCAAQLMDSILQILSY